MLDFGVVLWSYGSTSRTFWIIFVVFIILTFPQDIYSKSPRCKYKTVLNNLQPKHGLNDLNFIGQASSIYRCIDLACHNDQHKTVYFTSEKCYGLKCGDTRDCGFIKSKNVTFVAHLLSGKDNRKQKVTYFGKRGGKKFFKQKIKKHQKVKVPKDGGSGLHHLKQAPHIKKHKLLAPAVGKKRKLKGDKNGRNTHHDHHKTNQHKSKTKVHSHSRKLSQAQLDLELKLHLLGDGNNDSELNNSSVVNSTSDSLHSQIKIVDASSVEHKKLRRHLAAAQSKIPSIEGFGRRRNLELDADNDDKKSTLLSKRKNIPYYNNYYQNYQKTVTPTQKVFNTNYRNYPYNSNYYQGSYGATAKKMYWPATSSPVKSYYGQNYAKAASPTYRPTYKPMSASSYYNAYYANAPRRNPQWMYKQVSPSNVQIGNIQVGNAQVGNALVGNAQTGNAQVGNAQVGNTQDGNAKLRNTQVGNVRVGKVRVGNVKVGDTRTLQYKIPGVYPLQNSQWPSSSQNAIMPKYTGGVPNSAYYQWHYPALPADAGAVAANARVELPSAHSSPALSTPPLISLEQAELLHSLEKELSKVHLQETASLHAPVEHSQGPATEAVHLPPHNATNSKGSSDSFLKLQQFLPSLHLDASITAFSPTGSTSTHNPHKVQSMLGQVRPKHPTSHSMNDEKKVNSSAVRFADLCSVAIGMQNYMISDGQLSASSEYSKAYTASRGRLNTRPTKQGLGGGWCANPEHVNRHQYLQVDMRKRSKLCRIATQGASNYPSWVTSYKLAYSLDGKFWEVYKEHGEDKLFLGNYDNDVIVSHSLKEPFVAQFVRFWPQSWSSTHICMRAELYSRPEPPAGVSKTREDIPHGPLVELSFEKSVGQEIFDDSPLRNDAYMTENVTIRKSEGSCGHVAEIGKGGNILLNGRAMKSKPRTAITVSAWIKLKETRGPHSIFDTVGANSFHQLGQYHFEVHDGTLRFFHRNETGQTIFSVQTGDIIPAKLWTHVAGTYDSSSGATKVFINGRLYAKTFGHGLLSQDWEEHAGIGSHKGSRFLEGEVDEFRIYNMALPEQQIETLAKRCNFARVCGRPFYGTHGLIQSPDWPAEFTGEITCTWTINVDSLDRIILDFSEFGLDAEGNCAKSKLEIRDGDSDIAKELGIFCGTHKPGRLKSSGNHLWVSFTTSPDSLGKGFQVRYSTETARLSKKTGLSSRPSVKEEITCSVSQPVFGVTLTGGINAGTFSQISEAHDMDSCMKHCCARANCNVAFMIKEFCYMVQCATDDVCGLKKARPSTMNPRIAYVKHIKVEPAEQHAVVATAPGQCHHTEVSHNVTLVGGIHAGKFSTFGRVNNIDECIAHCCKLDKCDLAFTVQGNCYNVECESEALCRMKRARPSQYNPTIAYVMKGNKRPVGGPFVSLGCWRDEKEHVFISLEKLDPRLQDPYESREDAVRKCADVAKSVSLNMFGVQHGGQCFGAKEAESDYKKYGISRNCREGKGGPFANNIYKLNAVASPTVPVTPTQKQQATVAEETTHLPVDETTQSPIDYGTPPPDGSLNELRKEFPKFTFSNIYHNVTLRLGIKAGKFDDQGKVPSMVDCARTCVNRPNCDLAFILGGQCFSVACESESTCVTKPAFSPYYSPKMVFIKRVKPTTVAQVLSTASTSADSRSKCSNAKVYKDVTLVGGIKAGKFNYLGPVTQMDQCTSRCCKKSDCDVAFKLENECYGVTCTNEHLCETRNARNANIYKPEIAKMNRNTSLVKAKPTTPVTAVNHKCWDGEIMSNMTLTGGVKAGTFQDNGKVSDIYQCMNYCCEQDGCDLAFKIENDCYTVFCTSEELCKPRKARVTNYNPQIAFKKYYKKEEQASPTRRVPHSCSSSSIKYNMTLKMGMHSGVFTKLGKVTTMDECVELGCRVPKADVAYMLGEHCFAVQCYNMDLCKAVPSMATNLETLNPHPAISYLGSAYQYDSTGVLENAPQQMCHSKSSIVSDVTLRGGIKAGNFTERSGAKTMQQCINMCCDSKACDLAFKFGEKCYSVTCKNEKLCQAVLAKPSALKPMLSYVVKPTYVEDRDKVAGFQVDGTGYEQQTCSRKEGNSAVNKTLSGGLNAGIYTFLGKVRNIGMCRAQCCKRKTCDIAYLIDRNCFSIHCFSPKTCQITPFPATNGAVEIVTLLQQESHGSHSHKHNLVVYVVVGVVAFVVGLGGIAWMLCLFLRRKRLRQKNMAST